MQGRKLPPQLREPLDELVSESERGCAIVGAAWLEANLGELLMSGLSASIFANESDYEVLESRLKEFVTRMPSSRAMEMCSVLGLVNKGQQSVIMQAFKIRHQYFAHWSGAAHFSDPELSQELTSFLNAVAKMPLGLTDALSDLQVDVGDSSISLHQRFASAITVLAYGLKQQELSVMNALVRRTV